MCPPITNLQKSPSVGRRGSRGKCAYAKGRMTAHDVPGICHAGVTMGVESTMMRRMVAKAMQNTSRKRCQMRGTSMKKFERSTSCYHRC